MTAIPVIGAKDLTAVCRFMEGMTNESLPPLCTSALGATLLLVAVGVLPWAEAMALLGVVAMSHFLPLKLRGLPSESISLVRTPKRQQ